MVRRRRSRRRPSREHPSLWNPGLQLTRRQHEQDDHRPRRPRGSGKDTIAYYLVSKRGFVKMANADLLKRVAQSAFGFTDDQLWGPSELRNAPDKR